MLQPSEELQEPSQPPFELFYCYARKDRLLRNELDKHLTGLYRSKLIISWYDGRIVPGAAWEQEIENHLNSAHIILLLISPDFIGSDYCYSKEMYRAIERHRNHETRVIPILLRPVDLTDTPFSDLQMLPTDAKPVTRWDDRDAAFEDITKGIRRVITELSAQRRQQENEVKSVPEQQDVTMPQQEAKDQTISMPGNPAVTFPHNEGKEITTSILTNTLPEVTITPPMKRANPLPSGRSTPSPLFNQKIKHKGLQSHKREIILSVAAILLLLAGGTLFALVSSPPIASVTIVPDSKEVQDSYVMQAVTNQANADQLQVSMRNLSVAPDAQNKTVAGTGKGTIAAVAARGRLTFINGSFAPYTVASGTVISAPTGVSVVTEQPAAIPAGVQGGSNGTTSVPAHAVNAGSAGNLDQGSINKICCSNGGSIFVRNDDAFTGGVDAQIYTFVRQEDVDAAATPLETTLSQQATTQFKQQLKPNEKLVSDPTCNSNVQVPPGTVGNQGRNSVSTTITVTAKCTGVAYDQGAAQAIAKDRLQKKANIDPGQGYSLIGNIATDVSVSKVNQDSISLLVNARGIWAYEFDAAKEQALVRQLAGKKLTDAQALLNAQRGINNARITIQRDTLPTNPNQIAFVVQKIPGENISNDGDSNTSNRTPTPVPVSGKGLIPSDRLKTTSSI